MTDRLALGRMLARLGLRPASASSNVLKGLPGSSPTTSSAVGHETSVQRVGGPVSTAWGEGTLTRAAELQALCAWIVATNPSPNSEILAKAVHFHLDAARQAARAEAMAPRRRAHLPRSGCLKERAMSNLDAAEAHLLNIAPPDYVLGQMPSLLQHVRSHLGPGDSRREALERIFRRLDGVDSDHELPQGTDGPRFAERKRTVLQERGQIVTATRAASSASLREQLRVRSFRNALLAATLVMTVIAITIAVTGLLYPTLLPLCFAPEEAGQAVVVCPTQTSSPFTTTQPDSRPLDTRDIDDAIIDTARPWDLLVVELVGLTAAAIASAGAIRKIHGSSERYGIPVSLAVLKLPTGAVTAVLGLLLMRGQFVPGLSALDTSAQILAWALIFGYAQHLFTRLVDQQGQTVLNSVRGADKPTARVSRP